MKIIQTLTTSYNPYIQQLCDFNYIFLKNRKVNSTVSFIINNKLFFLKDGITSAIT